MAKKSYKEWRASAERDMERGMYNESFQGNGGGIWAGAIFGLGYGALAGAVIACVPPLLGLAPFTFSALGGTAALCGAMGAIAGRSAGGNVGASTGAAVGSTRVMLAEIRSQFSDLRKDIGAPPLPDAPLTAEDILPSEAKVTENTSGFFKWRPGALGFLIGAAIGVTIYLAGTLLGGEHIKPIMGDLLKHMGFEQAPLLGTSLIAGATAATFSFNVPRITSHIYLWARSCINGRFFETLPSWMPLSQNPPMPEIARPAPEKLLNQPTRQSELLAEPAPAISFQEYLMQREQAQAISVRTLH